MKKLLAIESSCDETAAAVIAEDRSVLSNVVASQAQMHEKFGGVVPEIAARCHVESFLPVIDEAMQQAEVTFDDLSAVAVATHPGLVGSLIIGVTAAQTISLAQQLPLIAVDHVLAHLYACRMNRAEDIYPSVGLVVSGGHTNLYLLTGPTQAELIGSTIDDAAGEAFDKVAQILDLGYPGGPMIEKLARQGDAKAVRFPRSFLKEEALRFSFSGLKTAVLYEVKGQPGARQEPEPMTEQRRADIAASFQQAVIDVLVGKLQQSIARHQPKTICIGGGVAANQTLIRAIEQMAVKQKVELLTAPRELTTDNAAMAAIAWEQYEQQDFANLDLEITGGLVRM